jgi:hypothetical protein
LKQHHDQHDLGNGLNHDVTLNSEDLVEIERTQGRPPYVLIKEWTVVGL